MNSIQTLEDIQNKVRAGFTDWEEFSEGRVKVRESGDLLLFTYSCKSQYVDEWVPFEVLSRGLVIEKVTGSIISRPFDKFFNWKQGDRATESKPKYVYEKVDGSMVAVSLYEGNLLVTTKGSFESEQALWAYNHLKDGYDIDDFIEGYTYIFEAVYPANRIVVNYGETEELVLLNIRNNDTGEYATHSDLKLFGGTLGFRIAERFHIGNVDNILELLPDLGSDEEGYVVEFDDGERFKFKGTEYLRVHRIISLASPKRILEYILPVEDKEALDNIYDILPDNLSWEVTAWEKDIRIRIDDYQSEGDELYRNIPENIKKVRKDFALYVRDNIDKKFNPYMFNRLTGKEINTLTYKKIKCELKDESLTREEE